MAPVHTILPAPLSFDPRRLPPRGSLALDDELNELIDMPETQRQRLVRERAAAWSAERGPRA